MTKEELLVSLKPLNWEFVSEAGKGYWVVTSENRLEFRVETDIVGLKKIHKVLLPIGDTAIDVFVCPISYNDSAALEPVKISVQEYYNSLILELFKLEE